VEAAGISAPDLLARSFARIEQKPLGRRCAGAAASTTTVPPMSAAWTPPRDGVHSVSCELVAAALGKSVKAVSRLREATALSR